MNQLLMNNLRRRRG